MRKIAALLLFTSVAIFAQAGPGISLGGSIGVQGNMPTLASSAVAMSSDANYTLTAMQAASFSLYVTSSVSLTANRNIVAPLNYGQSFIVTNATSGGKDICLIGSSGAGACVPNGSTMLIVSPNGVNYIGFAINANNITSGTLPVARLVSSLPSTGNGYVNITPAGVIGWTYGVPSTCTGYSCPNGQQINSPYTTTSGLTIAASIASTDTSITVTSTTGFPSAGCGAFSGSIIAEAFCWDTTDGTHLLGLHRGLFGSTASAITYPTSIVILGWVQSVGTSISSVPQYVVLNSNQILYGGRSTGLGQQAQYVSAAYFYNGYDSVSTISNTGGTTAGRANGDVATYRWQIDSATGLMQRYNNFTLAGKGIPFIPASPSRQTGLTATTTGNLQCNAAICPAGTYAIKLYANITTAGTGGTLQLTCGWFDGASQTSSSSTIPLDGSGAMYISRSCDPVYSNGTANLTYTATVTGATGSPVYALDAHLVTEK